MRPDVQKVLVVMTNGRQEDISNPNARVDPNVVTYEPTLPEAADAVKAKGSFSSFYYKISIS